MSTTDSQVKQFLLEDTAAATAFDFKKNNNLDEPVETDNDSVSDSSTHTSSIATPTKVAAVAEEPINITPAATTIHSESLEKINSAQEKLNSVKERLGTIIDSMDNNKSYLSKASEYVGQRPLYEQVIGGIVIVVPTLATGLALNIGVLYTISTLSGVTYAAAVALLNDNYNCTASNKDNLKKGVEAIAAVLETTIQALEKIREKFAEELEKFKIENQKLIQSVQDLGEKILILSNEIMALSATQKLLSQTKTELEASHHKLEAKIDTQIQASEKSQKELEETKQLCLEVKKALDDKTIEYHTATTQLRTDLEKARALGTNLTGMITMLSGAVFESGKEKEQFKTKLEEFMKNQDQRQIEVLDKLSLAEKKVDNVSSELSNLMEANRLVANRFDSLLTIRAEQDQRLANVQGFDASDPAQVNALKEHGLSAFSIFKPAPPNTAGSNVVAATPVIASISK